MIDLGKEKISVNCPHCNRKHSTTLNDVSRGATIKCNCKRSVQLKDNRGTVKRGINDANKAIKDFESAIKKLSNKTFKF